VIYMPMVPEAAIAMLACARLGAVPSVVFGGFAISELAARIDDSAAGPRARADEGTLALVPPTTRYAASRVRRRAATRRSGSNRA
jgi:acyl-coenzyme A synthetase/AMP-(fatty) acid ligase